MTSGGGNRQQLVHFVLEMTVLATDHWFSWFHDYLQDMFQHDSLAAPTFKGRDSY